MKNTLFLMTHLASGWEKLSTVLEECPNINVFQTGASYGHPDDVSVLHTQIHRKNCSTAIWCDVIFHNKDFTMKRLCEHYNFIFWSCPLEECVNQLTSVHNYSKLQAEDYWQYRMEGLHQYHKRCKNSLWNPKLEREAVLASILG
jgi:hypothetical protein